MNTHRFRHKPTSKIDPAKKLSADNDKIGTMVYAPPDSVSTIVEGFIEGG